MQNQVLGSTPHGLPVEAVPNLKRRQLAIYWRPHTDDDGETIWIQTRPLPADVLNKEMYLAKGFRLTSPDEEGRKVAKENEEKTNLLAEVAQLRQDLAKARKPRKRRGKISE